MSTNPDGIVGDYIVQFGASAHEVDFYDPETLAFVKTIKSSVSAVFTPGSSHQKSLSIIANM